MTTRDKLSLKEDEVQFLWYYLSKRIIGSAIWDECSRKFYVRLENDIITLTTGEYTYLRSVANHVWD